MAAIAVLILALSVGRAGPVQADLLTHSVLLLEDPDATLHILNESSLTICSISITTVVESGFSDDWLSAGEVILPGERTSFDLSPGEYDVWVTKCNGDIIWVESSISLDRAYEVRVANGGRYDVVRTSDGTLEFRFSVTTSPEPESESVGEQIRWDYLLMAGLLVLLAIVGVWWIRRRRMKDRKNHPESETGAHGDRGFSPRGGFGRPPQPTMQVPYRSLVDIVAERKERTVPLSTKQQQRNRENLLRGVRTTWIDGYLHNTVHHTVCAGLGFEHGHEHEASSRPWDITLEPDNLPIPRDRSLATVFSEHGPVLLIAGQRASGKTVTLLQLAEELLSAAREDERSPMPVVLNLLSWDRERQPLAEWLVEEMFVVYQALRPLTDAWLRANRLVLLLDGLDEVAETCLDELVASINEFQERYRASMVICARSSDYDRLGEELNITGSMHVQPLNSSQVGAYVDQFGAQLDGLHTALHRDRDLQELARSPLMLSLLCFTYAGPEAEQFAAGVSFEERGYDLMRAYVHRAFERQPLPEALAYDQPQALRWLTHLAQGMSQHKEAVFNIERLRASWLPIGPARRVRRLLGGLIGALLGGVIGVPLFVVIGGLIDAPLWGLLFGLFWALLSGVVVAQSDEIAMKEELHWSPPPARILFKQIGLGLLAGLASVIVLDLVGVLGLANDLASDGMRLVLGEKLYDGLYFATLFGLFFGLDACIQPRQTQRSMRPNQGIRSSLHSALRTALLGGPLFGLLMGGVFQQLLDLFFEPLLGLLGGLLFGLFFGLLLGLLAGLDRFGGNAVVRHYALRFVLARRGLLPFPLRDRALVTYLDAMADRGLLRRVGGGWVFIHYYLLEYFASADVALESEDVR